jgi:osomolarity two-component system sensor histidine kinase NIK1
LKILLVEDNPLNQKVVTFHLRKKDYDVVAADNGRDAINIFKNGGIDLILMDIMLPEMNGFETTKEIRKLEFNAEIRIPIIALTANTLDNDREKCLKAGMDDYLPKPFTPDDLYRVIDQAKGLE